MDIKKVETLRDVESAVCEINEPKSGDYWFSLIVAGPSHPRAREYSESEGRSLAFQGKRLGDMKKAMDARAEVVLTDSEKAVGNLVKHLMARTLDWKDVTDGGKPLPFDPKLMQAWYTDSQYLRDVVLAFIGDARNFTKGSLTTSSAAPSSSSN